MNWFNVLFIPLIYCHYFKCSSVSQSWVPRQPVCCSNNTNTVLRKIAFYLSSVLNAFWTYLPHLSHFTVSYDCSPSYSCMLRTVRVYIIPILVYSLSVLGLGAYDGMSFWLLVNVPKTAVRTTLDHQCINKIGAQVLVNEWQIGRHLLNDYYTVVMGYKQKPVLHLKFII